MSNLIRVATLDDAAQIAAIYQPIVRDTVISFEVEIPSMEEMRARIAATLAELPWLVSIGQDGQVAGYVYASRHRLRAAYQWSVDVTAYVRADRRAQGVGSRLYRQLFEELRRLNYRQAFAGITLPNNASVALHQALGFKALGIYRQVGFKLGAWHDVGWWQASIGNQEGVPCALIAFAGGNLRHAPD